MSIAGQASLVEGPADKATEIKRIVASSVIGTAVEWYDFLIYGTASALVFNKLFFPLVDPALGTIAAFAPMASATSPAPWVPQSLDISGTGSAARPCWR